MKDTLAKICYGLGFGSIAFSIFAYSAWGIDEATYVGLWVPSFFLVGFFFERSDA
jgi:hypothetical protein